jgi:hypothetical protein
VPNANEQVAAFDLTRELRVASPDQEQPPRWLCDYVVLTVILVRVAQVERRSTWVAVATGGGLGTCSRKRRDMKTSGRKRDTGRLWTGNRCYPRICCQLTVNTT